MYRNSPEVGCTRGNNIPHRVTDGHKHPVFVICFFSAFVLTSVNAFHYKGLTIFWRSLVACGRVEAQSNTNAFGLLPFQLRVQWASTEKGKWVDVSNGRGGK